ncbi:MAG TPA: DNA primase [Bryobacteraceae bacterium]|nr:DNA primase [Bryobacteraceae bacterium]HPQ17159.1 DNA primase [Bryobacteraceae bacterium]
MDFVDQLKSSIDIVDVVGQYVRLRKAGTRYIGLCPFHTERTPSFGVHSVHQFYKCFGCGAGGDVIKFVMEIEGLTFYEALKSLAERYGIPMPKRAEYSDPETKLRAALYRMHEIARDLFRAALRSSEGAAARAYLAKRGVSAALVQEFELGYADASGHLLTRAFEKEGFNAEQMEASGLVIRRQEDGRFYDRFRGRLMFPIHNEQGKVIAFGGRALADGQEPKYLNSSDTEIYHKKRVLFNLHRAKEAIRKSNRAVLVEGYMDVIGVWAAGVREVVASCGTALVSDQVRSLRRHTERVVVNFDPDQAGVAAAERSIEILLEENVRVRVLELEGGDDPDEYIKKNGAEMYRARVEQAPGYFQWLADRARARFDMQTAEGRIAGLQFLLPAIRRVNDKLERAAIAEEVANYLHIERGLVLEHFRKAAAGRRETLEKVRELPRPVEQILLNALLASEEVRKAVLPKLKGISEWKRFATRRIFETLIQIEESGAPFRFAELEARLADSDKEALAAVVFADKPEDEEYSLEQALACIRTLEEAEREARRSELKTRIKEAERAGMLEEALRITEELSRLDRN